MIKYNAEIIKLAPEEQAALDRAHIRDLVSKGIEDLADGRVVSQEAAESRLARFEVREVRPGVIKLYDAKTGRKIKAVGFYCQDCTTIKDKFMAYMAVREVWEAAGLEANSGGMLCIACLRKRIGRDIVPADLTKTFGKFAEDDTFLDRVNAGLTPSDAIE